MHSSTNDNGQRLRDMCSLYGLAIGGTTFEHKNIHKGTWRSPDKKTIYVLGRNGEAPCWMCGHIEARTSDQIIIWSLEG